MPKQGPGRRAVIGHLKNIGLVPLAVTYRSLRDAVVYHWVHLVLFGTVQNTNMLWKDAVIPTVHPPCPSGLLLPNANQAHESFGSGLGNRIDHEEVLREGVGVGVNQFLIQ